MIIDKHAQLDQHLRRHAFEDSSKRRQRYRTAKLIAEHYAHTEGAVAVLSDMAAGISYVNYGRLGERLGIGAGSEEVESIWEKRILERIHPDDEAEKIAWELQLLSLVKQMPEEQRADYYLQHYLRIRDAQGGYTTLRHRIYYLDYDATGNVLLALCLYNAHGEQHPMAGIFCTLDDTRVRDAEHHAHALLTQREREILTFIGRGWASKQIADTLCISTNTVNNHRQNILRKLQSQNTTEAVGVAQRLGLLD